MEDRVGFLPGLNVGYNRSSIEAARRRRPNTRDHRKDAMRDLIPTIESWFSAGRRVVLATVISTWGSAPRGVGSHMIVSDTGEMAGSVSGGCVEGAVVEEALLLLNDGGPKMIGFGVADELAWDVGLSCGGRIQVVVEEMQPNGVYGELFEALNAGKEASMLTVIDGPMMGAKAISVRDDREDEGDQVDPTDDERDPTLSYLVESPTGRMFIQPYSPPPRLIVVGAVHAAIPLVTLAQTLGYHTTVVDAREAFATRERFAHADELVVEWPDTALDRLAPDASTAVVVLTHDAKFDEPALATALRSNAGYIGAIGSRATSAERFFRLGALGFTSQELQRIHGPIGLDIGAAAPAETALSILAEIVAHKHSRTGGRLRLAPAETEGRR